jgi:hypothetical protein
MTTRVEKSVLVDVPARVAYNQWTQFEKFPEFMSAVTEVRQLDDRRLHWVAEIAGVRRQWDALILEQVPDKKIAWRATSGATNAGAVYFSENGSTQTTVTLVLEYEPEGLLETAGEKLHLIEKRAEGDLQRFKELIESRGYETGGWRGTVNAGGAATTPGVESAASTRGDSGKAGLSGKMKALGALAAVAGVVASGAVRGARQGAKDAYSRRSPTAERSGTQPVGTWRVVEEETLIVVAEEPGQRHPTTMR